MAAHLYPPLFSDTIGGGLFRASLAAVDHSELDDRASPPPRHSSTPPSFAPAFPAPVGELSCSGPSRAALMRLFLTASVVCD